jgi:hypothetical protein
MSDNAQEMPPAEMPEPDEGEEREEMPPAEMPEDEEGQER